MLIQQSERIYMMRGEEKTDRPYLYYIHGDRQSMMIDCGNSKAHLEEFYLHLRYRHLPMPAFTAITHWHWDHTFGMHVAEGTTIASERTNDQLYKMMKWEWTEEAMSQREKEGLEIPFCNDCIRVEYDDLSEIQVVPAHIQLHGRMEIDLGGVHVLLFDSDSPHSRDALFAYVPEEAAFFGGDADYVDTHENDGKYDESRLKKYISLLSAFRFDTYYFGHIDPVSKTDVLEMLRAEFERAFQ